MLDNKPISIILIVLYCFLLGLFFISLAINIMLSGGESPNWLPIGASFIMATLLIAVGVGILCSNQLCWKILFFCLLICMASVASFLFIGVISLFLSTDIIRICFQSVQSSIAWWSLLYFFLSEIIVLYYLTRRETVACFGEMTGELVTPF